MKNEVRIKLDKKLEKFYDEFLSIIVKKTKRTQNRESVYIQIKLNFGYLYLEY